jgi:hypothetical protein
MCARDLALKDGGVGIDLENIEDLTEPASAGVRTESAAVGKFGQRR